MKKHKGLLGLFGIIGLGIGLIASALTNNYSWLGLALVFGFIGSLLTPWYILWEIQMNNKKERNE